MSVLDVNDIASPAGAYSHAIEVRPSQALLFVAGQIGMKTNGSMEPDAASQTRTAFDNIRRILAQRGMTLRDIVKLTYFVCRQEDLADIRAVILENLQEPYPTASLALVKALGRPEWLIEIECVAAAGHSKEGSI